MRLVLFDLDNTLLGGDSDFEWGLFLSGKGVHDPEVYLARNQAFYDAYRMGQLDINEFLEFQLSPLGKHSREVLDQWHGEFMRERILHKVNPGSAALIARERRDNPLMAIVTATNSFVTGPIAQHLGIEHLVATDPEVGHNGEYTGKVMGLPCFREGKIERVDQWLHSLGHQWKDFDSTVFYSDSLNDLPLLQKVSHPVAVDPDPVLLTHANHQGWPVISLRQKS
jgi:HAD superfamily hydrolase (TIGR01490 family)